MGKDRTKKPKGIVPVLGKLIGYWAKTLGTWLMERIKPPLEF